MQPKKIEEPKKDLASNWQSKKPEEAKKIVDQAMKPKPVEAKKMPSGLAAQGLGISGKSTGVVGSNPIVQKTGPAQAPVVKKEVAKTGKVVMPKPESKRKY